MPGLLKLFHGLWMPFWREVRALTNGNNHIGELRVTRFPLALSFRLGGSIRRVSQSFGRIGQRLVGWVRAVFPSWVSPLTPWGQDQGQGLALAENNTLVVTAQAANWLLETTSDRGDQIAVAQFLCALSGAACAPAFEESGILRRLVPLACEALDVWHSQPNARNQEVAELFGLALCHTLLHSPKDLAKMSEFTDMQSHQENSFGGTFLRVLELVRDKYSPLSPEDEDYMLHICFLSAFINGGRRIQEYEWAKLSGLSVKAHRMSDAVLHLWAVVVFVISSPTNWEFRFSGTLDTLLKLEEDQQGLVGILSWAIFWSPKALISTKANSKSELTAAEIYTTCLQKTQALVHQYTDSDVYIRLADGIRELMSAYLDPLTGLGPGDPRLVKLSSEVILTLRTVRAKGSVGQALHYKNTLVGMAEHVRCKDKGLEAIFISSCRLWAPLEEQVALSTAGIFGAVDKPLTTNDPNRIVEFIEYIQKQKNREAFDFIARNADVGINRLYVHLDRRVDWDYQLYDLREQPTHCSRSTYIEDGML
ncbi:hypothetical protein FRC04_004245 [Tulasnella sp. 424]|nr:hypothetical protein FRC04_004245 [Tulasnella sp. 424]